LRTQPIPVVGVLAVMEVEAWFLAEHSHFQRVNPAAPVDCAMIRSWFSFDPSAEDMSMRPHPALDMSRVYFLAGVEYGKRRALLERAVNSLDLDEMYFNLSGPYQDLGLLIRSIEQFFFPPT